MDLDEKNLETVLALDGGAGSSQTEDFIQYAQAAVNVDDATELEPTQLENALAEDGSESALQSQSNEGPTPQSNNAATEDAGQGASPESGIADSAEPTQPVQAEPAVAENAPAQAEDGGNTDQIIDEVPPPTKVLLARKWKQSC